MFPSFQKHVWTTHEYINAIRLALHVSELPEARMDDARVYQCVHHHESESEIRVPEHASLGLVAPEGHQRSQQSRRHVPPVNESLTQSVCIVYGRHGVPQQQLFVDCINEHEEYAQPNHYPPAKWAREEKRHDTYGRIVEYVGVAPDDVPVPVLHGLYR